MSKFENGDTLLHAAVRDNKIEQVKLLLSLGAWPLGVKNNEGLTPYILAKALSRTAILQEMALAF